MEAATEPARQRRQAAEREAATGKPAPGRRGGEGLRRPAAGPGIQPGRGAPRRWT